METKSEIPTTSAQSDADAKNPPVLLVLGMAGSGKTSFVQVFNFKWRMLNANVEFSV